MSRFRWSAACPGAAQWSADGRRQDRLALDGAYRHAHALVAVAGQHLALAQCAPPRFTTSTVRYHELSCPLSSLGSAEFINPKGASLRLAELWPATLSTAFLLGALSLNGKQFLSIIHQNDEIPLRLWTSSWPCWTPSCKP